MENEKMIEYTVYAGKYKLGKSSGVNLTWREPSRFTVYKEKLDNVQEITITFGLKTLLNTNKIKEFLKNSRYIKFKGAEAIKINENIFETIKIKDNGEDKKRIVLKTEKFDWIEKGEKCYEIEGRDKIWKPYI